MKIGDYVRTLKGITKIIDIRDELIRNSVNGNEVVIETNIIITDNGLSVSNEYKFSDKPIDLIEVGDYVNGKEVFTLIDNQEPKLVATEDGCLNNKEIKSIVTKEQFESMEYNVEE